MRLLTKRDHDRAEAIIALDELHRSDPLNSERHGELATRIKALNDLAADHADCHYECPCGTKFTGSVLVLTYLSMYTLSDIAPPDVRLQTDYHGAHSITFCPDCAAKVLAHHGKR